MYAMGEPPQNSSNDRNETDKNDNENSNENVNAIKLQAENSDAEIDQEGSEEGEIIDDEDESTYVPTSSQKIGCENQNSSTNERQPAMGHPSITTGSAQSSAVNNLTSASIIRQDKKDGNHDERKNRRGEDRSSSSPSRKSDRKGSNSGRNSGHDDFKDSSKMNRKRRRHDDDKDDLSEKDSLKTDENGMRQSKRRTRWDAGHGKGGGGGGNADRKASPYDSDHSSTSDSEDIDGEEEEDEDDDFNLNEEMWMNMLKQMQEMLKRAKDKGQKRKREKMEMMMDKMLKSQASLNSREMRKMVLKNRRLFRPSLRDREFRERDRFFPRFRDRRGRGGGGGGRLSDRRIIREKERDRRMTSVSERDRFRNRDKDRGEFDPSASRDRERSPKTTCKFYLEGKCHKGADCPFPHDIPPPKKKDICKFYLQGFCGKGDSCLFMHGEFPCKFYHTGAECYSGDNCRFSHEPLTDETRQLLKNYLDSGELPDEINYGDKNKSGPKKPPILGDPSEEMRTSYSTWIWQQEMKELELAYKGTKRNLFCIDNQFVIKEKPALKPGESEAGYGNDSGAKVMSFYMDTMGDPTALESGVKITNEEDKLLEMSFHDEDLRLPPPGQAPAAGPPVPMVNQSIEQTLSASNVISSDPVNNSFALTIPSQSSLATPSSSTIDQGARDLPTSGTQNFNTTSHPFSGPGPGIETENIATPIDPKAIKSEPISSYNSNSDSDEDTEYEPLKAALKNLDQTPQLQAPSNGSKRPGKPKMDIAKMLDVIRQTSSQINPLDSSGSPPASLPANNTTSATTQHADFWRNILSGTSLVPSSSSSGGLDIRDPRLKRGEVGDEPSKLSSADTGDSTETCNYHLFPMEISRIDYSGYEFLYRMMMRNDEKLKPDPRLQNFFKNK